VDFYTALNWSSNRLVLSIAIINGLILKALNVYHGRSIICLHIGIECPGDLMEDLRHS